MFENMTFEFLLNRMLNNVSNDVDKREGSIIYDALAPAAAELAQAYIEMETILNETFADTASREYLVRRCAERGIVPIAATSTVVKAGFNINIPLRSRFSFDGLSYVVTAKIQDFVYKLECEVPGKTTNSTGVLTPIYYIEGLERAEIVEVLVDGTDAEETESLRKRYYESLESTAFGGNIADYQRKTKEIAGVGSVKVYPVWNGKGTVKISLLDSSFNSPSSELINTVQDKIDPIGKQGEGQGIAPINHIVTVAGATETTIDITTTITLQVGYMQEDIKQSVTNTIEEYLAELRSTWEKNEYLVIRKSHIENRILSVPGILDIQNTSLNSEGGNIQLEQDNIPVLGVITWV